MRSSAISVARAVALLFSVASLSVSAGCAPDASSDDDELPVSDDALASGRKVGGTVAPLDAELVPAEGAEAQPCPSCGEVAVELGGASARFFPSQIDGYSVIEGDMVVGEVRIAASTVAVKTWPGGIVPYEIDSKVTKQERITEAIEHWRKLTGIRLIKRTTESDYVRFVKKSGCYSALGRKGGKQEISLADTCSAGSTIHEIGHALGMFHEQSRSDRDDHVKILEDNIAPEKVGNYRKTEFASVGNYDIGSIMHYGSYYFSKNKKPTMLTKSGDEIEPNRAALSPRDISGIRTLYKDEKLASPAAGTGAAQSKVNASLREGPSSTEKTVLVVPKGATVVRLGTTSGSYTSVAFGGKRGWVYTPFLVP